MAKFNKDFNFGLPDNEDIEAILEQMSNDENIIRTEFDEERRKIAEVIRERQVLENSNVAEDSKTYIKRNAEIKRKENALKEEYRQLRQKSNPPKQVQPPQYAQSLQPKTPSYSVNTSESKPVVTRTEYKPIKKLDSNYENVAGWLMGVGGVAAVLWSGLSINNWHSSIQTSKQEVQPAQAISQETNETQTRRDKIQKKLEEINSEVKMIQLKLDAANASGKGYNSRIILVRKIEKLHDEYRTIFTGMGFEDREYIKGKVY